MDITGLQRMGIAAYSVGQPYSIHMKLPMDETPHLWVDGSELELAISYPNVDREEVHQINHGALQLAWAEAKNAGLLGFQAGDIPWADCPFNPHVVIEAGRPAPRLTPGVATLLPMILIEATTGIVAAVRVVSLPPKFMTAMATTIARLSSQPFDRATHLAELDDLYSTYSTSGALMAARAVAACALPGTGRGRN